MLRHGFDTQHIHFQCTQPESRAFIEAIQSGNTQLLARISSPRLAYDWAVLRNVVFLRAVRSGQIYLVPANKTMNTAAAAEILLQPSPAPAIAASAPH